MSNDPSSWVTLSQQETVYWRKRTAKRNGQTERPKGTAKRNGQKEREKEQGKGMAKRKGEKERQKGTASHN